jgi:hypothetical protein
MRTIKTVSYDEDFAALIRQNYDEGGKYIKDVTDIVGEYFKIFNTMNIIVGYMLDWKDLDVVNSSVYPELTKEIGNLLEMSVSLRDGVKNLGLGMSDVYDMFKVRK